MKRRQFIETMAACSALPLVGEAQPAPAITKAIPSSNERIPVIGMHPAVTCAIPATTQRAHVIENMGAGRGRMPDGALRLRMADYFRTV